MKVFLRKAYGQTQMAEAIFRAFQVYKREMDSPNNVVYQTIPVVNELVEREVNTSIPQSTTTTTASSISSYQKMTVPSSIEEKASTTVSVSTSLLIKKQLHPIPRLKRQFILRPCIPFY